MNSLQQYNLNVSSGRHKLAQSVVGDMSDKQIEACLKLLVLQSTQEGQHAFFQRLRKIKSSSVTRPSIKHSKFKSNPTNDPIIQREFVDYDSIGAVSPRKLLQYLLDAMAILDRKDSRLAIENRILKDGLPLVNNVVRRVYDIKIPEFQEFLDECPSVDEPVLVTSKCHESFTGKHMTYIIANLIRRVEIYVEEQTGKPFSEVFCEVKNGNKIIKLYQELVNTKNSMIEVISRANKEGRQQRYANRVKRNRKTQHVSSTQILKIADL